VRAVAGVARYAVWVSACATAFFCVGNDSPHAPQPYEASPFAAARCALPFRGLLALPCFAAFDFAGFFAAGSFFGFVSPSAFAFGSRFAASVPSILQNLHPLHATPSIAAFPADDGLRCSIPSSNRYRRPSVVSTTSHVRSCFLYRATKRVPAASSLFSMGMFVILSLALLLGERIHHSGADRSQRLTLHRRCPSGRLREDRAGRSRREGPRCSRCSRRSRAPGDERCVGVFDDPITKHIAASGCRSARYTVLRMKCATTWTPTREGARDILNEEMKKRQQAFALDQIERMRKVVGSADERPTARWISERLQEDHGINMDVATARDLFLTETLGDDDLDIDEKLNVRRPRKEVQGTGS
jgi:hypothetical protein